MTDRDLLERAVAAADAAYAPYSNFHVGAAMLLRNGEIVDGVNVENAAVSARGLRVRAAGLSPGGGEASASCAPAGRRGARG